MKQRPILFSAPMVRAILDGRKTQTRRVMKPQPTPTTVKGLSWEHPGIRLTNGRMLLNNTGKYNDSPYGQPGDQLWVRETWTRFDIWTPGSEGYGKIVYRADGDDQGQREKWHPSIHMPRATSRILLEITGIRVEGLQEISETDAIAEGVSQVDTIHNLGRKGWEDYENEYMACHDAKTSFQTLWQSINSPDSWNENPWVWVIEFKDLNQ